MRTETPLTLDTIQPNPAVDDFMIVPRRDELSMAPREFLRRGPAYKADIFKVELGHGPVVVKDFSRKSWVWRQLGRYQIHRELRAYRHLGRMEGLPRLVGAVDADALALEWIEGGLLKTLPDRIERGATYVGQLVATVDRIHATGLAHLDLRSNNNIVVRKDGRVFVLDLASAVRLKPGGLPHRLLFGFLAALDVSGLLKWKLCLQPETLTDEERKRLRRHERLSSLWFVNRKRKNRAGGSPVS